MENKNINLLWSAGHNCALALTLLQKEGYRINSLISVISKSSNEIPKHGTPDVLIKNQARALVIPSLRIFSENDQMENLESLKNVDDLYIKKSLNYYALSSSEGTLSKSLDNIKYPLSGMHTKEKLKLFLDLGHKAIITCIDEEFVPLSFLGREITNDMTEDLSSFPKDSFHTYTTYAPQFKTRMNYSKSITVKRDNFTIIRLREV